MRLKLGIAAWFALVGLLPWAAAAETVELTILAVNDIDQMSNRDGRGGYARLAAVVRSEREKGGNVLFVHAGDAISPSLMAGFDQGAHILTLLNMITPDVFVPGNHEYDFGRDTFLKRMGEARFVRLAANLRDRSGSKLAGFEDTKVVEVGGARIGFVGLTASNSAVKSSPGDLKVAPIVPTGVEQAKALRADGADFVVAVAHAKRSEDRELFDSRAFDLIVSGDDHDLMVFYDGRTAMVESKEQGQFVTAVDLSLDVTENEGERRVTWWPEFRIIDTSTVEPDPAVQAKVAGFEAELSKELDVPVGKTTSELDSRRATVRSGEAAIGNLIADAMRDAVSADVALMNGGGIRADKLYAPGTEITRRDILSELPFGNRTVKLEVTGETLRAALENGFSAIENAGGRFPHVSGMEVVVDLKAAPGSRVKSITVAEAPLDPARTYTLATNDFVAGGGDGYTMLTGAKRILNERDGSLVATHVMAAIRKRGEIGARVEGRIKSGG